MSDRAHVRRERKPDVTRFEVIDHRSPVLAAGYGGRVFTALPCSVELSYQDDGRTLKVFVTDAREGEAQS